MLSLSLFQRKTKTKPQAWYTLMIKKMLKNREKYQTLSLEQKRMICKYNDDHNGIKQTQLIVHFISEFN